MQPLSRVSAGIRRRCALRAMRIGGGTGGLSASVFRREKTTGGQAASATRNLHLGIWSRKSGRNRLGRDTSSHRDGDTGFTALCELGIGGQAGSSPYGTGRGRGTGRDRLPAAQRGTSGRPPESRAHIRRRDPDASQKCLNPHEGIQVACVVDSPTRAMPGLLATNRRMAEGESAPLIIAAYSGGSRQLR
jgi:hypothetical protein